MALIFLFNGSTSPKLGWIMQTDHIKGGYYRDNSPFAEIISTKSSQNYFENLINISNILTFLD